MPDIGSSAPTYSTLASYESALSNPGSDETATIIDAENVGGATFNFSNSSNVTITITVESGVRFSDQSGWTSGDMEAACAAGARIQTELMWNTTGASIIEYLASYNSSFTFSYYAGSSAHTLRYCVAIGASLDGPRAFSGSSDVDIHHVISADNRVNFENSSSATVTFTNCDSIASGQHGFKGNGTAALTIAKNCRSFDPTNNAFQLSFAASSDNNMSTDATAPGTTTWESVASADVLVDNDILTLDLRWRIGHDGTYEGATGVGSVDIDGVTRVDWDIGPFENGQNDNTYLIASSGGDYTTLALLEADILNPTQNVHANPADGYNAASGAVTVSFTNGNSKFLILQGLAGSLPRDQSGWATNQRSAAEACGYFGEHISVNGAGSLLKAEDCVFRDGGRITFNGTTPDISSTVERCLFFDHVTVNHSFIIRLRLNTAVTVSNCAFWGGFAPFGFDNSASTIAEYCTWTGNSKLVNDTGGSGGNYLTTYGCRGDRWDGETALPLGDWNSSATSDAGNPGTNSETSVSDATYLTNVAGNSNDSTGTVDLNPAQADGVADANYTPTLTGVDLNGNARTYTATAFGCMDTSAGGGPTTSPWYYYAQQQVVSG